MDGCLILVAGVEGYLCQLGVLLTHRGRVLHDCLVAPKDSLLGGVSADPLLQRMQLFICRIKLCIGAKAGHAAQLSPARLTSTEV